MVYRLVLVIMAALVGCTGGDRTDFRSIGTGGTAGIYYPLGGAMAAEMSTMTLGRRFTAEVTGGSVENANRVARGEMDLGFTIGTTLYEAYHGGRDFQQPLSNLRIVAPLYPSVTHFVAASGAPIQSVGDVRGRRISVGPPGSGTEQVARQVLEAYGLTYDDVEERFLSFRESADALRDGAIDLAVFTAGFPAAAVLEMTTSGIGRLVPIDAVELQRLAERYSYYNPGEVPEGAYPGMSGPVATVTVMNWLVGAATLEPTIVVDVLTMLLDRQEQLARVHDAARQIDLSLLDRPSPIPVHDAVLAWRQSR